MIGDRHGYRHINADHAYIDLLRKLPRRQTIAGKNRHAIAILMLRRQTRRFFEAVGAHHLQDRTKNFFLIGLHVGGHIIEQRRADKEAVFMALQRQAAAIDQQIRALFDAHFNIAFNLGAMRG